jgi:hypothetical protein
MTEVQLLSDVNTWVGIGIAFVGAAISGREGAKHVATTGRDWFRARVLRRPTIIVPSDSGHAQIALGVELSAHGDAWRADGPLEEKVELLRGRIAGVEGRLGELKRQTASDLAAIRRDVTELEQQLRGEHAQLLHSLDAADVESARVDARGLPIIAWGILLSGAPSQLASLPFHLGWIFPVLGIGVTALLLISVAPQRR